VAQAVGNHGPRLLVEPASCRAAGRSRRWQVTWRIENQDEEPLTVLEAWAPHGQFRSQSRRLEPVLGILPRQHAFVDLSVACGEASGTVVENAFLVLRLEWRNQLWRALARHRVRFAENESPEPICEVVTTQPLGFAEHGTSGTAQGHS
jgi:hypothetical protein